MKANELRIGNLVNCPSITEIGIFKVATINSKYINGCDVNIVEPIPLTEEWLVKFGFKANYVEDVIVYRIGNFQILWHHRCGYEYRDYNLTRKVKYVHSLQNLYFALTGEELTYE